MKVTDDDGGERVGKRGMITEKHILLYNAERDLRKLQWKFKWIPMSTVPSFGTAKRTINPFIHVS